MSFALICGVLAAIVAIVSMIQIMRKVQVAGGVLFICQGMCSHML